MLFCLWRRLIYINSIVHTFFILTLLTPLYTLNVLNVHLICGFTRLDGTTWYPSTIFPQKLHQYTLNCLQLQIIMNVSKNILHVSRGIFFK